MSENQEAVEAKEKNFFAKWIGIYFSPSETFASLDRKPDWFIPLLLTAILTVVFVLLLGPYMQDASIEAMMDRGMTEDQAYEMLESPWMKANSIFGGVAVFIMAFIIAGIFYLVFNFMMGGESDYKKVLSVYSYTGFAVGVVGMIVKLPLMIAKGSMLVQTSPAAFLSVDSKDQFMYKFLAKFDIFVIWEMILLIIGFGLIYKFSRGKSAAGVLVLWGVYIIASILLGNLFSGLGGSS